MGLVGDPQLLFLDEPTTGFDPTARRNAWALVESLRALGKTVLLTTHYMDEAEHLADRVAVIAHGRLIALGTPDELQSGNKRTAVVTFRLPPGVGTSDLPSLDGDVISQEGADWQLSTDHPTASLSRLTSWAADRGLEIPSLEVSKPSLEDTYLALVGADDGAAASAK